MMESERANGYATPDSELGCRALSALYWLRGDWMVAQRRFRRVAVAVAPHDAPAVVAIHGGIQWGALMVGLLGMAASFGLLWADNATAFLSVFIPTAAGATLGVFLTAAIARQLFRLLFGRPFDERVDPGVNWGCGCPGPRCGQHSAYEGLVCEPCARRPAGYRCGDEHLGGDLLSQ